ncbi:hypothetical protein WDV85_17010 [Pseudokineococcus sp. 5B2Z-1]|uniref:hypothetical protein n=1 Tax=Pseudokineococcus sp. 5B2Z-1 TaxID=3132744 RepID=UPI0030A18F6C
MSETVENMADEAVAAPPRRAGACRAHTVGLEGDYLVPQCACHLLPGLAPRTTRRSAAITLEAAAARQGAALQVRVAVANHGPIRAHSVAYAARMADEWGERASDPLDDEMVTPPRCLRAAWRAADNAADLAAEDQPPATVEYDRPTFAAGWQADHDRHENYSPNAPTGDGDL